MDDSTLNKIKNITKQTLEPVMEQIGEFKKVPSDIQKQITGRDSVNKPRETTSPIVEAMLQTSAKDTDENLTPEEQENKKKKEDIGKKITQGVEEEMLKLRLKRVQEDISRADQPLLPDKPTEPGESMQAEFVRPKGKAPRGKLPSSGHEPNIETRKSQY